MSSFNNYYKMKKTLKSTLGGLGLLAISMAPSFGQNIDSYKTDSNNNSEKILEYLNDYKIVDKKGETYFKLKGTQGYFVKPENYLELEKALGDYLEYKKAKVDVASEREFFDIYNEGLKAIETLCGVNSLEDAKYEIGNNILSGYEIANFIKEFQKQKNKKLINNEIIVKE